MATVHVVLSVVDQASSVSGNIMPVAKSIPYAADTVTTSASSVQSSLVAPQPPNNLFWEVKAKDADVWVNFGSNPTAAVDVGWLVSAGETRQWAVTTAGEKCAVVNA